MVIVEYVKEELEVIMQTAMVVKDMVIMEMVNQYFLQIIEHIKLGNIIEKQNGNNIHTSINRNLILQYYDYDV
jgi:hypothetical protein